MELRPNDPGDTLPIFICDCNLISDEVQSSLSARCGFRAVVFRLACESEEFMNNTTRTSHSGSLLSKHWEFGFTETISAERQMSADGAADLRRRAAPSARTRYGGEITHRERRLPHRWLLVLAVIIAAMKNEIAADEIPDAADRAVNMKFASAVSMAVQDPGSFDVFAIAPAARKIHRFTARQLMTGVSAPAASFQFEGEPQRVIVRSIGDSRFAFVQCANPMMLVQLEAESLKVVRQIPLSTSVVADLFGSEAKDDPCVWLIIDGKPARSRSAIRQWKLAVVDFGGEVPTVVDLLDCSAALVTPDGKTILTSASGKGVTRSTVSFDDKRSLTMTVQPEQPALEKMRLRPGSFFSPDRDAIIVAGQWLATEDSVVDTAVPTPGDVSPAFAAPIISFLRSSPLAVCLAQRTLDEGTMEPSLQFVEIPSGKVLSTLAVGEGVDLTRGGRDWRMCETPDNSGLLHVTSTHVRFLPNAILPAELKELLNAPPMMLQTRPDLAFRIGEVKEVPMQPTDPRSSVTLRTAPEGMTLHDGILRWQPGIAQQGRHTVEIEFIAGSVKKTSRLEARADFDVQKLPASYYRLAYSPILRLLAGATVKPDRTSVIDILRADERGQFNVIRSIPTSWPATDLAMSSMDGKSGSLAVSGTGQDGLVVFDPFTGTKTAEFTAPASSVNALTVAIGPQRSLLVYGASQSGAAPVDCAGLVDLKSGKHLGLFRAVPDEQPGHPERIVTSADPPRQSNRRNVISHASISSDGESVHLITRTFDGTGGVEYSEWAIPDDLSHESTELNCLYRANISELQGGLQDLRLLSGGMGFAAIRSRLFTYGQQSARDNSLFEPQHFVTGRPFLIQSHVSDSVRRAIETGLRPTTNFSVVALNSQQTVTPEFSLSLGPLVSQSSVPNTLLCASDETTQTVLFARGESLTRIPYAALGIDDQLFDPAVVVSGPRMLQAGNEYEFPLKVFPPAATVSIEKSPAGTRLEDNRLKWKVAADAGDLEAIILTVTHGAKSRTAESLFSVAAAVPVAISETIPRYTFDRESGLIAGIDATTGLVVFFDIEQLRLGRSARQRTLKLDEHPQLIEFKRVEDKLWLVAVSDHSRRVRVVDPDTGDVQFDLKEKLLPGINEILASPDATIPLVILKSGENASLASKWQLLNVKTGEVSLQGENQSIVSFSNHDGSLALHDAGIRGQLVIADIADSAFTGLPLLINRRLTFHSNTEIRVESKVDFQFHCLHQAGTVYSANEGATGRAIQFEPLAFFDKSPFFLSVTVDEPANQNQPTGIGSPVLIQLMAVSRNTLKPVGRPVTLRIPPTSLNPHDFRQPRPVQMFLSDDEKKVLVTSPRACCVVPIAALRLPDEVSLALQATSVVFPVGTESTVDLRAVDDRATISISSLPDGITFEENKLKWTPRPVDAGSRSLVVRLQAGDQERSETIQIRATLPGLELPYRIAGMSAEPQKNVLFLWGNMPRGADGIQQSSMCIVDLSKREIVTQAAIAAEEFQMAIFEGKYIVIALADRTGQRLVVLNSDDLSVVANVPLQVQPLQLGLLRKEKMLVVSQNERILRCSVPDLKWQDENEQADASTARSAPAVLTPHGITRGQLSVNWNGSNRLWRVREPGVIHVERIVLQPEFAASESIGVSSFTFEDLRIAWIGAGPSMIVPPSSSGSPTLHAGVFHQSDLLNVNTSQVRVRVSCVTVPNSQMFPLDTDRDSDQPTVGALTVGDSRAITLVDQAQGQNQGNAATTGEQVFAAYGSNVWMIRNDQLGLTTSNQPARPTFVHQQSHFLLEGTGQTKLTHTIHGGDPKIRFVTANRIAGVSVDASTGDVTVDHKIIADSVQQEMMDHLQSIGVMREIATVDAAVVIRHISARAKELTRQVITTGKTLPEGIPVFVPIELVLLHDGQPVDALGYTVAVMVAKDSIMAAIDTCVQSAPGNSNADIEELRRLVNRLEHRLQRAESILRENGLEVPQQ